MAEWRGAGRTGRRYREARQKVIQRTLNQWGYLRCHICGHPVAVSQPGEMDHHPLTLHELLALGLNADNPDHMQLAHGATSKCYDCLPNGWPCNSHGRSPYVGASQDGLPNVISTQGDGCWCGGQCTVHIDPTRL